MVKEFGELPNARATYVDVDNAEVEDQLVMEVNTKVESNTTYGYAVCLYWQSKPDKYVLYSGDNIFDDIEEITSLIGDCLQMVEADTLFPGR